MAAPLPVFREGGRSATVLPLLDCNARCPFCSTRVYTEHGIQSPIDLREGVKRRAKDYTLSLDELRAIYDGLRADGVDEVSLQGGEPTLHPGLLEILAYGWQIGLKSQTIVTNGRRLADLGFTRALLAAKPSTLVLSLFGADAATHDESMGVSGAFDDVVAGVRHLVALRPAGAPIPVMAQLTLHGRNHRDLPEMLRFWYAQGLRDFSVRLLRETENTGRGSGGWFFDLELLRAPLDAALDAMSSLPGAHLRFGELPSCLPSPRHLGRVLADLGQNPALSRESLQRARHFEKSVAPSKRDAAGSDACASCDLAKTCLRVEKQYAPAFTGTLRAWDVAGVVRDLGASVSPENQPLARELVAVDERLAWFGSSLAERRQLRGALARSIGAARPEALCESVLGERGRKELANRLDRAGARPVRLRAIALSSLGELETLDDPLLAEKLRAAAAPGRAASLKALASVPPVATSPLLAAFAWIVRAPSGEELVLSALFDDRELDAAHATAVLAGATKRA